MTMTELEEAENILLPGIYPIWSPYDSYDAANALMDALAADKK